MRDPKILEELEVLKQRGGGVVNPHDMVDFARNPDTRLHQEFEWDDAKASESWRVHQARQLLRVYVTMIGDTKTEPVRAFVSLKSDRHREGGYRAMVDVMSDEERRQELLRTAFQELAAFERKYQHLQELDRVFVAFHEVADAAAEVVAA